jgi:hypothetical protein
MEHIEGLLFFRVDSKVFGNWMCISFLSGVDACTYHVTKSCQSRQKVVRVGIFLSPLPDVSLETGKHLLGLFIYIE